MIKILHGDCSQEMQKLDSKLVNCCVTSPPYWGLRDYDVEGQIGLEKSPEAYVEKMVSVFKEVHRVLKDDGTLWLNLGDSYNAKRNGGHAGGGAQGKHVKYLRRSGANVGNLKPKDLVGIPWRVAFALQKDGWYLRQDIIWHKPNPMPESVTDRCTKAHEYIFLLSKNQKYYFDLEAIKEKSAHTEGSNRGGSLVNAAKYGSKDDTKKIASLNSSGKNKKEWISCGTRQKRSVWSVANQPYLGAHFAAFPADLIEPCILAGCPIGGTVLDPFFGSGTVGLVTQKTFRKCIGIELNADYIELSKKRTSQMGLGY